MTNENVNVNKEMQEVEAVKENKKAKEKINVLPMRELQSDDIFPILYILGKLDVKDDIVTLFEKNAGLDENKPQDNKKKQSKADLEKAFKERQDSIMKEGVKLAATVVQKTLLNIKDLKMDINDLLVNLTETDHQTISELSMIEYFGLIKAFFQKEELKDFFTSITSL